MGKAKRLNSFQWHITFFGGIQNSQIINPCSPSLQTKLIQLPETNLLVTDKPRANKICKSWESDIIFEIFTRISNRYPERNEISKLRKYAVNIFLKFVSDEREGHREDDVGVKRKLKASSYSHGAGGTSGWSR